MRASQPAVRIILNEKVIQPLSDEQYNRVHLGYRKIQPKFPAGYNLRLLCDEFNMEVDWVVKAIKSESGVDIIKGTGNTAIHNQTGSSAKGIFQVLESTARFISEGLLTAQQIADMSIDKQLFWLSVYLRKNGILPDMINSTEDLKLAIRSPASLVNRTPDNATLYASGSIAYEQNKSADKNKDGILTVGEFKKA